MKIYIIPFVFSLMINTNIRAQNNTQLSFAYYGGLSIPTKGYYSTNFANTTTPISIGQAYQFELNISKKSSHLFGNCSFQFTSHQAEISSYLWNDKLVNKSNFSFSNEHVDPYNNFLISIGIGGKYKIKKTSFALFPILGLAFTSIGNQYNTFDTHRSKPNKILQTDYDGWGSVGINWGAGITISHPLTPRLFLCMSSKWVSFNTSEIQFPDSYTNNYIYYRTLNILLGFGYSLN